MAFPAALKEILWLVFKLSTEVTGDFPGSETVYVPPESGPPILVIVNVAERSLLHATPNPTYGSETTAAGAAP